MNELLLASSTSLEAAGKLVAGAVGANVGSGPAPAPEPLRCPAVVERLYLDTFDGLLRRGGASAVHVCGRLTLVDRRTGHEQAACALAVPHDVLRPSELPASPLRREIERLTGVRALLALTRVSTRSLMIPVLDARNETVVRVLVEEPTVLAALSRPKLASRIRVIAPRGQEAEADRVLAVLADSLKLSPPRETVLDEAVRASGGDPAGTSAKVAVSLEREMRTDAAAAAVLLRLSEIIIANLPGVLADIDSEFLHDLRVAVRRTRSVQRELKGAFPPAELHRWRGEFRWLQAITGDVRDLDVYLIDFEEFRAMVPERYRDDLAPLREALQVRRVEARKMMVTQLGSERARSALYGWPEFVRALPSLPGEQRPDAEREIAAVAAHRIHKVYRAMLRDGRTLHADTPAEQYHELRKRGKELRYLLELFGAPLFSRQVVAPMVGTLKALQDTLGRHQDREVQVAMLRRLAPEVAARPGGPRALLATGVLVERLGHDEVAARGEFSERFAAFSARRRRRAMKEAFAA